MTKKRITENPSTKELLEAVKGMEILDGILKHVPSVTKIFPGTEGAFARLEEIKAQAHVLFIPDRFNELFCEHGWIAYESLNLELMKEAIALAEQGKFEDAENHLADYYNEENCQWLMMRLRGHNEFRRRSRLIELAMEDYLQKRYHACIPLLLSLTDGLVNDISKHVGIFAENIDMTAWDSIAAHESGLQALVKIMNMRRGKTNEEKITIPYRNGILHGRELAFDNKLVAAKCWSTLFAVRDWAASLDAGKKYPKPKEEKSLLESLREYGELEQQKKRLSTWRARENAVAEGWPTEGPSEYLLEGTPEKIVAEFIENWTKKRYGKMAEVLVDPFKTPLGKKAGQVKRDFGHIMPSKYKMITIEDEAAAISCVKVEVTFSIKGAMHKVEIAIRAIFQNADSHPLIRGEHGGSWRLFQASFSDIIYRWNSL